MSAPAPSFRGVDSRTWVRVEELFFAALQAERPDERDALLDEGCGHDDGLRRMVEELLSARRDADAVLGTFARRAGLPGARLPGAGIGGPASREGKVVGAYRLVREIGRGGMGSVYLGERSDRVFQKKVAVKLLPAALEGAAARERFARERRILARLDHPGIARLLDGGMAPDGSPFFVMEYVDGRRIDEHCDHLRMGIDARIHLFLQVCEAVEYAHRNLVIHRDVKPANVLVTAEGRAKLLDFGVARLQDADDTGETTALTRWGGRPLTPAYASPEQVRGEPLTTASDVYSLGVLLHRLLSGGRPYETAGASPAEVERIVCGADPTPPSFAIARPRAGPTGTADAARLRGTTPRGLRRRLEGDLDTIVLTALRKEPERRYGSAAALADDLHRHLEGRPVEARPAGIRYRLGKLATRRPGLVAAVVAGIVATGAYGATLHLHANRLAVERNAARLEAERRAEVTEFLTGIFDVVDPSQVRGETVTAEELLERGAEAVERLAHEPDVQGELYMVLSRIYHKLGFHERSESLARAGLEVRRRTLDEEDPEVAASLARLGRAVGAQGDLDEAERLHRAALTVRRDAFGDEHPEVAAGLVDVATVLLRRGELDGAEAHFREALAVFRASGDDEGAGESLNGLGLVHDRRGELAAAAATYREALERQRGALGANHPTVASTLHNLGVALARLGDLSEAERHHREALEIRRGALGEDHPMVAASIGSLGRVLQRRGEHAAAAAHFRDALALYGSRFGADHPSVAAIRGNLGNALHQLAHAHRELGELDEAETYLLEALRHYGAAFDEAHPRVAEARDELALLVATGGGA